MVSKKRLLIVTRLLFPEKTLSASCPQGHAMQGLESVLHNVEVSGKHLFNAMHCCDQLAAGKTSAKPAPKTHRVRTELLSLVEIHHGDSDAAKCMSYYALLCFASSPMKA
jgi:hypothetical protein